MKYPDDMDTFHDHPLKRWRQQAGMSQAELAKRCGMSQKAISAYERYRRRPRDNMLLCLMDITGLPFDAFLFPEKFLERHPYFPGV